MDDADRNAADERERTIQSVESPDPPAPPDSDDPVEPTLHSGDDIEPTLVSGIDPATASEPDGTRVSVAGGRAAAPVGEAIELEPGARVGSYRLVRLIGKGAQGSVWHAFNEVAERDFALKFINSELLRAKWATASMRSEANVLFDLTHPSIVRLNTIEQVGQHLFLVMELIGGPSLSGFIRARRKERGVDGPGLDVDECLWMLDQLAPALDYAAGEGVTHRDIKPGNLMLSAPVDSRTSLAESSADVKICDFGIAFVEEEVRPGEKVNPTGTPPYMAPEVIEGQVPTWRADVYSLAATLYAMHKGEPPARGGTLVEILEKIKAHDVAPLDSGDRAFDAAIARGLSVDPDERQESFDELLYEASDGRLGVRARGRSKSYRVLAIASTLLAVGAVGYALDPFGLRRGQVEFEFVGEHGERDGGTVVTTADFDLPFRFRSPGDEIVVVTVDDGEPKSLPPRDPGSDDYQYLVELEGDGLHEVTVLTEDLSSVLGQRRFFLDTVVELPPDPVRAVGQPPFDRSAPIPLAFVVDEEGVDVYDRSVVPAQRLDLDFSEGRAEFGVEIPAESTRDRWTVTREFLFKDRYENERNASIDLEVYDGNNIEQRLRDDFPGSVDSVHLWDLRTHAARVEAWRGDVLAAPIPVDRSRALLDEYDARIDAVLERVASPAKRTLELVLDDPAWVEDVGEDGSHVLHTKRADLTISGTTENSWSADVVVGDLDGTGITVSRAPTIDRASGRFSLVLSLANGADGRLRLALPEDGPVAVVQVVRDVARPSITVNAPKDHEPVALQEITFELDVTDAGSGLDAVTLVGPDGAETEFARDERGDGWRTTVPLALEGENAFQARAIDRVGNVSERNVVVIRDTTAPAEVPSGAAPASLRTGAPAELRWRFDEAIAGASATVRLVDAAGETTTVEPRPEVEGGTVTVTVDLPFRPIAEVGVDVEVRDALNNVETVTASYGVAHDPWGAAPTFVRNDSSRVEDTEELIGLVGVGLGRSAYVRDGDEWFPRCVRHTGTGIEFVYVPSGSFQYGFGDAARKVEMSGFYVARTEISEQQWFAGPSIDGYREADYRSPTHPIRITRDASARWCSGLGFDLPTEAQWEYAASGNKDLVYPWGNEPDESRRNGPSTQRTGAVPDLAPVDAFPRGRSWCGALQMVGNLAEICRDDLPPAATGTTENPEGARTRDKTGYRIRGGSTRTAREEVETVDGRWRGADSGTRRRHGFRPVWPIRAGG